MHKHLYNTKILVCLLTETIAYFLVTGKLKNCAKIWQKIFTYQSIKRNRYSPVGLPSC